MDQKQILIDILEEAKAQFSPSILLSPFLHALPSERPIYVIAMGKAAFQMAEVVSDTAINEKRIHISRGLVVTKYGFSQGELPDFEIVHAGHPIPDENSLYAAETVINFLTELPEEAFLLILLSGGASAMMEKPIAGVSLTDIVTRTETMLKTGLDIESINRARKLLSQVKGGKLYPYIKDKDTLILVQSDVAGDKPEIIASNPFLPEDVQGRVQLDENGCLISNPRIRYHVIANNRGFCKVIVKTVQQILSQLPEDHVHLISTSLNGEAATAGREIGNFAQAIILRPDKGFTSFPAPCVLIFGGEPTVSVKGGGYGGRCTELALSAAIAIAGLENCSILAYATDGSDGNAPSSGAIVDGWTKERLLHKNIIAQTYLDNNDSFTALNALGSTLPFGPTGINVNDIVIMYIT